MAEVLDAEQREELRRAIRAWAETEIAPHAAATDRDATFPQACFDSFVGHGWVRLQYPEEYGGDGADAVSCVMLIEEIARVCASSSLFALISKLGCIPVLNWGSEELKARYIPAVARGESQFSYALSEPDAGSDVAAMTTRAVRDGDSYVLSGTKCWITNAGVSDRYTVFAKTDPDAGHRGISAFVVEAEWGVQVPKHEDKLGVRGSPTGVIVLDDVRVPASNLIGDAGQGFYLAMGTLDRSRPTIGAQAVGIAQGALDAALAYLKERKQFGRALADNQGLQFMIADMGMKIEAARGLVYRACEMIDTGAGNLTQMGAMAKCFAADTAMAVATDAVQLLGGYGFTKDSPVERYFRDAKITQIYEGTNQIQRIVIARELLR